MNTIRWVTPEFAVAPQITPEGLAEAKAAGFQAVINNRPEAEQAGQPTSAEMSAAAESLGLPYRALPFQGAPPPAVVAATAELLDQLPSPVLAYCRTGTRSIMAWGMAQALSGARSPDEIIALAAKAGYDIAGTRGALEALSPRS